MIEWYWILLIVAAIFMVPYLIGVRKILKRPSNSEESPTAKETAKAVLALSKTVLRLDREVERLKNHGGRKT